VNILDQFATFCFDLLIFRPQTLIKLNDSSISSFRASSLYFPPISCHSSPLSCFPRPMRSKIPLPYQMAPTLVLCLPSAVSPNLDRGRRSLSPSRSPPVEPFSESSPLPQSCRTRKTRFSFFLLSPYGPLKGRSTTMTQC